MDDLTNLDGLSVEQLIDIIREKTGAGVNLSFPGKAVARSISRQVRPRVQKTVKTHSVGDEKGRANNLVIEGDNLQALQQVGADGYTLWGLTNGQKLKTEHFEDLPTLVKTFVA